MAGGVKMMNHIWNKVYNFLNELRCENKSESIVVQLENCSKEKDILESQTDNPLYDKIVRLLHKCSPELLSVVLATTEALLALSHDSQDNTEK